MEDENLELEPLIETEEETVEIPEETEEVVETPEVDVDALQVTNKKLYERAKKAEAELKALKGVPKSAPASPVNVEEVVLQAQGMSEELLGELKAVAKVRGISLIKAQNDPIFVALKDNFEKDIKQKTASLGASRGSGSVKPKVTLSTPGLSREEHRRLASEL